jgi:hypothetical protein
MAATSNTARAQHHRGGPIQFAGARSRRYRAYRQRRRNGKACLRIEINMGEWADALVSIPGGFLQQWDSADKAAVERATEEFLTFLIAEHGWAATCDGCAVGVC